MESWERWGVGKVGRWEGGEVGVLANSYIVSSNTVLCALKWRLNLFKLDNEKKHINISKTSAYYTYI